MGILATLCIIVAVIGLILIVLSLIPGMPGRVPHVGYGVTLLVVGVVLYLVIVLFTRAPLYP